MVLHIKAATQISLGNNKSMNTVAAKMTRHTAGGLRKQTPQTNLSMLEKKMTFVFTWQRLLCGPSKLWAIPHQLRNRMVIFCSTSTRSIC